jgi:site-specific recombinase XerD
MDTIYLLHSAEYQLLQKGFGQWLQTLGYAPITVTSLPRLLQEFLHYQEQGGKPSLVDLQAVDASAFIEMIKIKIGPRSGRGYSAGHINKYIQALKLFNQYIRETGRTGIGFTLSLLDDRRNKPDWLTSREVQCMYEAISDDVLGIRDRAMLAVYYGCGLRLSEGAALTLRDIIEDRRLVYVRQGKGYKERYVPMAGRNYREIQLYIAEGRPQLVQGPTDRLFIGAGTGKPLDRQSLYIRVKRLVSVAGLTKRISTHTLRHSIATHLLQNGMKLERIAEFLGHSCVDSTQLYTHLVNEKMNHP